MTKLLVLCHVDEINGFSSSLLNILEENFAVVPHLEFEKNTQKFADKIIAIISFHANPKITKELLSKLPNLKIVASCGAGYNHIDVEMVKSFGVKLSNSPNVLNDSVADMAMLLLMSAGRNLLEYVSLAKENPGFFPKNKVTQHDIHNCTLGIVGMGRIGHQIALRAKAFNMKILYHNKSRKSEDIEQSVGATYYSNLHDLLPLCDYVMVAVSLSPATTKLFGEKEFKLMKSSSIFVNISRGAVVDQEALTQALLSKEVFFAALDVTEPEPLPTDHPLLHMNNVIITPHCGSATVSTRNKMVQQAVDNVVAAINNRPLPSEVIE